MTPWTGSRPPSISSHHIHHSSACVCLYAWFHTWLPCCLLTMHVFISSMCVYVCVWCRKTITIRILDREEYNKQSSFYVLLDSPQWRRSRKKKTGVRASQHSESQINWPTATEKIIIRNTKSLSSNTNLKGRALYLFCPAMSPCSRKKGDGELRWSRWGSRLRVYFYFMLIWWARQECTKAAKGMSTLQLAAEQGSCNEIRTAAAFISWVKWQNAALLPNHSCFYRPVDMGLDMHWSNSAAPLCT